MFIGLMFVIHGLASANTLNAVLGNSQISSLSSLNPLAVLIFGGIGVYIAVVGFILAVFSEFIGIVLSAEDSIYRMANSLESYKISFIDRLIKPTSNIENAGDALKKAFANEENIDDKFRPKG